MGGNLFKLGRRPRDEYLDIEADVRRFLDELIPDRYRVPRYYGNKPDFGDLDVVVDRGAVEALGGMEVLRAAIRDRLGVVRAKHTGHVYATVYRDFQVDYFLRRTELFEATYHYLSFNDLGNILGRMCKRLGLKYGEDGLSYIFRRPSQPSYKVALPISRDWPRILGFLELDVAHWEAGFETLYEMFEWAVHSPWFSVAPYVKRDTTTKRRVRQRRTMAELVRWLEREKIEKRCEYRAERDAYVPEIAAAFPEADLEGALAEQRAAEADAIALRAKFNGELVRGWTGLEGKDLGELIRRIRNAYTAAEMLAMSPQAIRSVVQDFDRDPTR
jgi:hypothetical protein